MAEKNIIAVSVEDRFVNVADHTKVMAGNVGIDYVQVTLDSEWDGLSVAVTFTGCAEEPTTVDYSADPIAIPWEQIAEAGELHIGVRGTDPSGDVTVDAEEGTVTNSEVPTLNADTMLIPIQVFESGESGGQAPQQPSPTLLDRVQQDIVNLERLNGNAGQIIADANAATSAANTAASNASNAAATASAAAETACTAASSAESAADAANAGAALAESAASKATDSASKADAATKAAQAVVDEEEQHRLAAKASADAAAASASAAASSQTAAKASETAAASSEGAAASSASAAAESASAASSSESKAKASETAAKASETAATSSKNAAASSASAAKESEASAAASKSSAAESATAAKASADAAAASAAAAKASETNAGQSATDASASKAAAATSATTAGEKATAAKASETSAAASANSASASQTAAKGSQTASEEAAERAEAAAEKAESIAGFTVDSAVTETSANAVSSKAIYSFVSDMAEQIRTGMVEIVDSLPAEGKPGVIYMVAADNPTDGNLYAEYVYKNGAWEKLGDVQMPDLSPYAKTAEVAKAIQDALKAYTTTETLTGLLAAKQDALTFDAVPTAGSSNPVRSSGVKTALDSKADGSVVSALSESVTDLTSQHAADKAELEAGIAKKQDKLVIDSTVAADSANPVSGSAVAAYVAENGGGKTLSNADFLELING